MVRYAPAILSVALAATGCTALLDPGQQQCETTADCAGHGATPLACMANVCVTVDAAAPPDPIWGCLGNVVAPTPDPSKKVTITEQLVLAIDFSPVTDVTVDVCDKLDVNCTGTNPDFPKGLHPDAQGNVTAAVQQGFDGFVRVLGPTTLNSLIFIGQPLITPPSVKVIQLLRPNDYSAIAQIAGQTVNKARGTAILEGIDCEGQPNSGIRFTSANADAETLTFYLINMLPQHPPMTTQTDVSGYGGFFNMPVGSAVGKAYLVKGDVCIGESSFNVDPYTISYVLVAPSPTCS
jgi:hypothetical protein